VLCWRRGEEESLLAGLWELPTVEVRPGEDPGPPLGKIILERTGITILVGEELTRIRHSILDRNITMEARAVTLAMDPEVPASADWDFLDRGARGRRGFSSMYTKILKKLEKDLLHG
jgi:adenine-specific DNA glycosylase